MYEVWIVTLLKYASLVVKSIAMSPYMYVVASMF
jgi:hypothetical protein